MARAFVSQQDYTFTIPIILVTRLKSAGFFLLMGAAFGTAFPAIKAGLSDAPPLLFAALRYDLAALLLLAYAAFVLRDWRPHRRAEWAAVAAGGVLFIGGTGFLYLGQQYTTSGASAIIYSLGPILTAAVAWLLLPTERLSRRALLGILIGFLGVGLVVRPTPAPVANADLLGKVLVLIAITSVTIGTVALRRIGAHMPIVKLTGLSLAVGAILLHAASLLVGEPQAVRTTPTFVAAYLYLALIASGVGFVAYFSLLERVGPLQANLVVYLVPIVAAVVGWAWLGETLTGLTLLGFLVIFAGFVITKWTEITAMMTDGWRVVTASRRGVKQ